MTTIPALADCNPGIQPVEYNVLILPLVVEEKTKSGLILPETVKEAKEMAQQRGLLVAVSPLAFNFDTWPEERAADRPKEGDVVLFAKFAGIEITGDDGRTFRICKDKDVAAVIRPKPAALAVAA